MKSADAKALATKQRAAERAKEAAKKVTAKKTNPNTQVGRTNLQQTAIDKSVDTQKDVNRFNTEGPFGSRNIVTNPDGSTTIKDGLGSQQGLYDQQLERDRGLGNIAQGQLGQLGQSASRPYDLSGIGNDPTKFNYDTQRKAAEDKVYNQFASRNEPRFEKEQKDFAQRMASQGIPQDSDKYKELAQELSRNQQDQRDSASTQAFQLGGSEEAQAYGQGLQSRQQGVSEYGTTRNAPYQDMANVLGLQKGLMLPQFQNVGQVDVGTVDAAGIASNLATEATQRAAAQRSGGGAAPVEPFSLQSDPSYQRWLAQQQYIKQNPAPQPKGPSTGQQIGQIVGQVGGTAGGIALGNYLGG